MGSRHLNYSVADQPGGIFQQNIAKGDAQRSNSDAERKTIPAAAAPPPPLLIDSFGEHFSDMSARSLVRSDRPPEKCREQWTGWMEREREREKDWSAASTPHSELVVTRMAAAAES